MHVNRYCAIDDFDQIKNLINYFHINYSGVPPYEHPVNTTPRFYYRFIVPERIESPVVSL